jgi:hypothetical protein
MLGSDGNTWNDRAGFIVDDTDKGCCGELALDDDPAQDQS